MQKKSRILVFTTAFRPMIGGSEIALEEIMHRLPDIFFDIVTPRHRRNLNKTECFGNTCINRVGFGFKNLDKLMFPVLGCMKALLLTRSNTYSKFHAYQASYGGGVAWLLKLFYPRTPFVLTLQEGKNLAKQNILARFFRSLIIKRADVVTGISIYLADYARKINPKAEVFIIPNGVNPNKFKIESLKPKVANQNEKVIITVSRLVKKNGVGDLIEAFHVLNSKLEIKNLKLVIVGDGPLKENLKFEVKSLKLEDKVRFLGEISNHDLPKYLAEADVFVRPSLSEGLGTAFLEAMAAGVPVVGTSVGGIPDFLKDGETGLFCKVGDPEDIADKINTILLDSGLRERLIINGHKLVEEKYNWDKIAEQMKEIYLKFNF